MSETTSSPSPEPRRPDPAHGKRIAMIAVVGALAAGIAVFALRDPQAAMEALVPGRDQATIAAREAATKHLDEQGTPPAFVSPTPPANARPAAAATGAQAGVPDWEADVLSGRRKLSDVALAGAMLRTEISTQVLESAQFDRLSVGLRDSAVDQALAGDYEQLAHTALVSSGLEVIDAKLGCSDRLCLMALRSDAEDLDIDALMHAFRNNSGGANRIHAVNRQPAPGGGYQYRVLLTVDPSIQKIGTLPGD